MAVIKAQIFIMNHPIMRAIYMKIQKDQPGLIDLTQMIMKIKTTAIMRINSSKKTINQENKAKIFTNNLNKVNKIKAIHVMTHFLT